MKKLVLIAALLATASAARADGYYTRPNMWGGGVGVFSQGGGYVGQVVPNTLGGGSTIYGANGENEGQVLDGPFSIPGVPGVPGIPQPY